MIVTKSGEQLTIYNSKVKWTFIPSLFQFFIMGFFWFISVRGWLDFHNHFGRPGPPLDDPFFVHKLESLTSTYLVMALVFTGIMWYVYAQTQNKGLTMLSRQAKALKVGKYLATVTAVDVRKQSVWRSSFYTVVLLGGNTRKIGLDKQRSQFRIQQPESAKRLALAIGDFLDVPVTWPVEMA